MLQLECCAGLCRQDKVVAESSTAVVQQCTAIIQQEANIAAVGKMTLQGYARAKYGLAGGAPTDDEDLALPDVTKPVQQDGGKPKSADKKVFVLQC